MLEIDYEPGNVDSFLTDLDKVLVYAATHAVNRAASSTRQASIEDIRSKRKLKIKPLRKGLEIDKAKAAKLHDIIAKIKGEGSGIPINAYSFKKKVLWGDRGKRTGVEVEIKSGQRKLVKGAFIRRVKNFTGKKQEGLEDINFKARVFKRKSSKANPIRLLYSSEVSSVFANTIPYIIGVPAEKFGEVFERDLDFYLRKY